MPAWHPWHAVCDALRNRPAGHRLTPLHVALGTVPGGASVHSQPLLA